MRSLSFSQRTLNPRSLKTYFPLPGLPYPMCRGNLHLKVSFFKLKKVLSLKDKDLLLRVWSGFFFQLSFFYCSSKSTPAWRDSFLVERGKMTQTRYSKMHHLSNNEIPLPDLKGESNAVAKIFEKDKVTKQVREKLSKGKQNKYLKLH